MKNLETRKLLELQNNKTLISHYNISVQQQGEDSNLLPFDQGYMPQPIEPYPVTNFEASTISALQVLPLLQITSRN